jgi:hypothetical protein
MIKNGIIVILAILAVFLFFAKNPTKIITNTKIDTFFTYKTVTNYKKGNKIKVKILDTLYKTDTANIVKEYNEVKQYTDTINQNSNVYVIQDTISQNRIVGRSFQAQIQEKTFIKNNTIITKPKAALYIGFRSDISNDYSKVNHNITLSFKTRQKGLFSVGYGMSGYSVGYSLKL